MTLRRETSNRFLKQFLSYFAGQPDNLHIDVESVEKIGRTFYISTASDITEFTSEIESLKQDIKYGDEEIRKLQDDLGEEKSHSDKLEKKLDELYATFLSYEVSPGETVKGLVDRNDELNKRVADLQESLNKFHRRFEADQREIKDLRARKNKASVKRCLTTGQLVASFDGVEYEMVKKN